MSHTDNATTLPEYQAFAEALARWDGSDATDRRELVTLFERFTAEPQSSLYQLFIANPLLLAACSGPVGMTPARGSCSVGTAESLERAIS